METQKVLEYQARQAELAHRRAKEKRLNLTQAQAENKYSAYYQKNNDTLRDTHTQATQSNNIKNHEYHVEYLIR